VTPSEPSPASARAALVLLAAGSGTRAGRADNKVFVPLSGRPVFAWSLVRAAKVEEIVRTVMVVRDTDRAVAHAALDREEPAGDVHLVTGGSTRHESEWAALQHLAPDIHARGINVVVVHDAARPLATSAMFRDVITTALGNGGAIPVRDQLDLLPLDHADPLRSRGDLVSVQTPQAFRAEPLLAAFTAARAEGFAGTDTASCFERYAGLDVVCQPGAVGNIKITYAEDLLLAERLIGGPTQRS
jgi:2-C-methyl-D-erythritol 4-phosphate cytidylyltransferase